MSRRRAGGSGCRTAPPTRPAGARFRQAWDAALDYALHRLEQAALSRALHGVPRPIFYKGEQVGEWRDYDERLTLFLLHNRRRARFGKWTRHLPDEPPSQVREDIELDGRLDGIEFMDTFLVEAGDDHPSRVEE